MRADQQPRPEDAGTAPADHPEPDVARPMWQQLAIVLAVGLITLVTFVALFSAATGQTPPWWPW